MGLSWISRRSSSRSVSSSHAPEADSTALEEIRLSTETQQRNGFRQSTLPDHGDRILEDIQNGNYICSICLDAITEGNTMEYSIWHCRECYNVYHFRCAKAWSESFSQNQTVRTILGLPRWKCPSCLVDCLNPTATCWCGKHAFGLRNTSSGRPNACLSTCARLNVCTHGETMHCLKPCHPGPCKVPCSSACDGRPVVPKPLNWRIRLWTRLRRREQGEVRWIIFYFTILAIIYGLMGILLSYHIRWWTKPFKYPQFSTNYAYIDMSLLIVGGNFVLALVAYLLVKLYTRTVDLLICAMNLNSVETKWSRKIVTRFSGGLFLAAVFLGLWTLPIFGFAGGPEIAWNNQMKNSCDGLNTRISMDPDFTSREPATKFDVHSLSPNLSPYTLYLGSHLKPAVASEGNAFDSSKPFQYYQRLSIERNAEQAHPHLNTPGDEYFAIDVDVQNQLYRVMHLNRSDVENEFLADGYKKAKVAVPTFEPLSERLISSGDFTIPSPNYKHMHIPNLNIAIANMYDFVDSCHQEPFIKVYQNRDSYWGETENKEKNFHATLDEPWDSRKEVPLEHEIVMRTASFGHGRQRLDMCILEELGEKDGKLVSTGVYENMFVPFAIMAAHRRRVFETDSRPFGC